MATFTGTNGDDSLTGSSDDDRMYGLGGHDSLSGRGGDDTLYGGEGNDTLDGGADDDRLEGDAGADSLYGGAGDGDDTLIGGSGNDTLAGGGGENRLTGGEGADVFIISASSDKDVITDFDASTGIGNKDSSDNDFVDLSAFYNEITLAAWNKENPKQQFATPLDWLRWEQSQGELESANELRILDGSGRLVSADLLNEENTGVVCFAAGTLILTDRGEVAIEEIAVGDLVRTRDNGLQPVRWIGSRELGAAELAAAPKLRPIRIRAGALGNNTPERDLLVSPQHRVLIRSKIAQKMFGTNEVLAAAKQLVLLNGIDIDVDVQEVRYFHMLFTQHEIVWSNGAETETLYTGPEALKAVGKAAVEELFILFPELSDPDFAPEPARPLLSGRLARKLGLRHQQNHRPLVAEK